jgi:hypothetical protein
MARPQKAGLDYFPLDVDIDQDDKVAIIEAQHGLVGFGIVVKLLMKIYKNGYYYSWTEKEQLLFSRGVNVDINTLNEVVSDCIKWGLFSNEVYEKENILTSNGIQLRYLEATTRRQAVKIKKEHLLICSDKVSEYKNLVLDGVNVDINPNNEVVNVDINPQRREEKSKEEKSKKNSPKQVYDEASIYFQLASYFFERIRLNNPDHKQPNLQTWSNDIRLLMEVDNKNEEQIRYLMKWVQEDSFECVNVLSPSKLRKRFDQLVMKVKQEKKKVVSINRHSKQEPQGRAIPKEFNFDLSAGEE